MNIDSRFRDNYYSTSSTDWKMDLPVTQYKVSSMRVASIEFPLSFYAVSLSRGNATMVLLQSGVTAHPAGCLGYFDISDRARPHPQGAPGPGAVSAWLLTLPDGNYETRWDATEAGARDVGVSMNNAIAAAIPGMYSETTGRFFACSQQAATWEPLIGGPAGDDITFAVQQASGKARFEMAKQNITSILFAVDRGGNRDLSQNLQLKLGWQLGFRAGSYTVEAAIDQSVVSESICSPCGPRYGYLAIDDGNNNYGSNLIASFASSSFSKNIMLRLNLASEVSGSGIYKYVGKAGLADAWWRSREYFGPVTISKLGFKLFDEYGRVLDLNGMDWSMALVFESIYD